MLDRASSGNNENNVSITARELEDIMNYIINMYNRIYIKL